MLTIDGISSGSKAGIWTRPYHVWFNRVFAAANLNSLFSKTIECLHVRYRIEEIKDDPYWPSIDLPLGVNKECKIRRRTVLYTEVIFPHSCWYEVPHSDFQIVFGEQLAKGYDYLMTYAEHRDYGLDIGGIRCEIDNIFELFYVEEFEKQFLL